MTPKTVFTVGFSLLAVVVLAVLVVKTRVALTLTGMALLLTLALEHGVSRLENARPQAVAGHRAGAHAARSAGDGAGAAGDSGGLVQGGELFSQFPKLMQQIRSQRHVPAGEQRTCPRLTQFFGQHEPAEGRPRRRHRARWPCRSLLHAIGGAVSLLGSIITVFFLVVFMLVFGGGLLQAPAGLLPARAPRALRAGDEEDVPRPPAATCPG